MFSLVAIGLSFLALSLPCHGENLIVVPGSYGPAVVEATVNVIRESCIFEDDKLFLRRLAYVESRDGTDPKTYRPGYDGGIWQVWVRVPEHGWVVAMMCNNHANIISVINEVDQSMFTATQSNDAKFHLLYDAIKSRFNIDWMKVTWSDLRKPLYSALAMSLFTFSVVDAGGIPRRIEEQASFWEQKFHQQGTSHNFTVLSEQLDNGCHGNEEQDIVFILDSSSSLSTSDFVRATFFVENVVSLFNISPTKTRVAVVVFSSHVHIDFDLAAHTTLQGLVPAIQAVKYRGGGTNTADAINSAVNDVLFGANGSRVNAAKIIILVTDGQSNDAAKTKAAGEMARNRGVVMFAIGVGTSIEKAELDETATDPDCTHVFYVTAYNEMLDIKDEIEKSSCTAPLMTNGPVTCVLGKCPAIGFMVPTEGITIYINTTCNTAEVFAAFNNPIPNSAYFEYKTVAVNGKPGVVYISNDGGKPLYVTVHQGLSDGSTGCVVTITPYQGHLVHTVKVECLHDGISQNCTKTDLLPYTDLLCKETWEFTNPCTDDAIKVNNLYFPYPYDNTKYVHCSYDKRPYIIQCPKGELYMNECHICVGPGSQAAGSCGKKEPNLSAAYCTGENIAAGNFYFVYPTDVTKFIQCDVWGHAFVKDCMLNFVWDQSDLICVQVPVINGLPLDKEVLNPCIHGLVDPHHKFHSYPLDNTHYIECDPWGQAYLMECPSGLSWNEALIQCGQGSTGQTPPPLVHTALFTPPCTRENIANNKLYFPISTDRHSFIQCDANGHLYIKSCHTGFFDPTAVTCVDGPIIG